MTRRTYKALLLSLLLCGRTDAQPPRSSDVPDVGIDQRIGCQAPMDVEFRDEAGVPVTLRECSNGKPVLLILAYYRCPMLCTQVLNGTLDALRAIPANIGDRFEVVTVSFDPQERPVLAAAKKASYLAEYGRSGCGAGWRFLTGDAPAIEALTKAVGFRYAYDADHLQYAHASGVMILTPDGTISRYFYGIKYSPKDLWLGMVEASSGKLGTAVDQLLLLCYHYDPATGKYSPAVMNIVRAGGVAICLAVGSFMALCWRRDRLRNKRIGTAV